MKTAMMGMSAAAGLGYILVPSAQAAVATFESVMLAQESHWDGSDRSGTPGMAGGSGEIPYTQYLQVEGSGFYNTFTKWDNFGSWSGFAISNHTDTATNDFVNQYSAITGGGAGGSANYAIGFYSTYESSTNVALGSLMNLSGLGASFTNSTWAALDMAAGLSVGKKFGGLSGDDPDWFMLTVTGYIAGVSTDKSVNLYLADFRSPDNSQDYILDEWVHLDFTSLGSADELRFSLSSSDNGRFGMNTLSYFAMDDFLAVPEPSSLLTGFAGLVLFLRRRR